MDVNNLKRGTTQFSLLGTVNDPKMQTQRYITVMQILSFKAEFTSQVPLYGVFFLCIIPNAERRFQTGNAAVIAVTVW